MNNSNVTVKELHARTLSKSAFKHAYRLARYHDKNSGDIDVELAISACAVTANVEALNKSEILFSYNLIYEIWVRLVLNCRCSWVAPLNIRLDKFKFEKHGCCGDCKETEFCICIPF